MNTAESKRSTYFVGQRGNQYFGFNAQHVSESFTYDCVAKLPGARPEVVGVVNLRNTVLPVLLPDRWLLTEPRSHDPLKPLAVLSHQKTQLAIQLDSITGVYTAPPKNRITHTPTNPRRATSAISSHCMTASS